MPPLTRQQKRKLEPDTPVPKAASTSAKKPCEEEIESALLAHGGIIKDPKDLQPNTEYAGWQVKFLVCTFLRLFVSRAQALKYLVLAENLKFF